MDAIGRLRAGQLRRVESGPPARQAKSLRENLSGKDEWDLGQAPAAGCVSGACEGDTLLVPRLDRPARSTLYRRQTADE